MASTLLLATIVIAHCFMFGACSNDSVEVPERDLVYLEILYGGNFSYINFVKTNSTAKRVKISKFNPKTSIWVVDIVPEHPGTIKLCALGYDECLCIKKKENASVTLCNDDDRNESDFDGSMEKWVVGKVLNESSQMFLISNKFIKTCLVFGKRGVKIGLHKANCGSKKSTDQWVTVKAVKRNGPKPDRTDFIRIFSQNKEACLIFLNETDDFDNIAKSSSKCDPFKSVLKLNIFDNLEDTFTFCTEQDQCLCARHINASSITYCNRTDVVKKHIASDDLMVQWVIIEHKSNWTTLQLMNAFNGKCLHIRNKPDDLVEIRTETCDINNPEQNATMEIFLSKEGKSFKDQTFLRIYNNDNSSCLNYNGDGTDLTSECSSSTFKWNSTVVNSNQHIIKLCTAIDRLPNKCLCMMKSGHHPVGLCKEEEQENSQWYIMTDGTKNPFKCRLRNKKYDKCLDIEYDNIEKKTKFLAKICNTMKTNEHIILIED